MSGGSQRAAGIPLRLRHDLHSPERMAIAGRSMEFLFDLGLLCLGLAVGVGFLSGAVYGLWQRRRDVRGLLMFALPSLLLGAPGILFVAAAFGSMHHDFGLTGCAALGGAFALLAGIFLLPRARSAAKPLYRDKAEPDGKSGMEPRMAAPRRLAAQRLWRAAPGFFMASAHGLALSGHPLPLLSRDRLGETMELEFLAIHSFVFMGALALPRIGDWRFQIVRWFLFVSLLALYVNAALSKSSGMAVDFLLGVAGTYGGCLGGIRDEGAMGQIVKRWVVSSAAFLFLALALRMPEAVNQWSGSRRVLAFGMVYFLALAVVEMARLYDRPWMRLPEGGGSRKPEGRQDR